MSDKPKPISDDRLEQLYGAYFHLRLTGVAPNVEWDDFRERESAYGELQQRRELASRATPGWKLVPVKLTGEMWSVGRSKFRDCVHGIEDEDTFNMRAARTDVAPHEIWDAMLSASPSPPETKER